MYEFLVIIETDYSMYEERIEAESEKEALKEVVNMLIEEGEIDEEEWIHHKVKEIED